MHSKDLSRLLLSWFDQVILGLVLQPMQKVGRIIRILWCGHKGCHWGSTRKTRSGNNLYFCKFSLHPHDCWSFVCCIEDVLSALCISSLNGVWKPFLSFVVIFLVVFIWRKESGKGVALFWLNYCRFLFDQLCFTWWGNGGKQCKILLSRRFVSFVV